MPQGAGRSLYGSGNTVTATVPSTSSSVTNAIRLPLFVAFSLTALIMAEQADARPDGPGGELRRRQRAQPPGDVAVALQRMAGEVEAQHLLLEAEQLVVRPLRHPADDRRRDRRRRGRAAQRRRRASPGPRRAPAAAAGRPPWPGRGRSRSGPRRLERVEGAGLDEALDHAPVDQAQVDARAEVVERGERPRLRADSSTMDSMAASPTFLMAASPKRIASRRHRELRPRRR